MRNRQGHASVLARVSLAALLGAALVGLAGAAVVVGGGSASATSTTGQLIADAAASQAGIPYCYGGGGINGPSQPPSGMPSCPGGAGYSCMSLAQFAVYQVTGITVPAGSDISLPGEGTFVPPVPEGIANLEPGDVMFFGGSSLDDYAHSGIYAGNDEIWDALTTGTNVQEHTFGTLANDYGEVYWGAVRYSGGTPTTSPPPTVVTPPPSRPPTPPSGITTPSMSRGTVSTRAHPVTYSQTLEASGGTPPYTWSLVKGGGSLPHGLRLAARSGTISGKATAAGTFSFEVRVVDKKTRAKPHTQHSWVKPLSITIVPAG